MPLQTGLLGKGSISDEGHLERRGRRASRTTRDTDGPGVLRVLRERLVSGWLERRVLRSEGLTRALDGLALCRARHGIVF